MRENYVTWKSARSCARTPCLAVIDCKGGNGIVATTRALDIAVEKARRTTFGFVGLRNTTHIGRLGDYTRGSPDRACSGWSGSTGAASS